MAITPIKITLYGKNSMPTVADVRQFQSCDPTLITWDKTLVDFEPQQFHIGSKFNPSTQLYLDGNEEDDGYEQSVVNLLTKPQSYNQSASYNSIVFPELDVLRCKYIYVQSSTYNILLAANPGTAYRLIKSEPYDPVTDRGGFVRSMQYDFKLARGVLS
jgi:hypothetical protein